MGNDYKVADITLSDFGRREISLAENEMPALMALREKYKDDQPLNGAKILGCIHMTVQTGLLMETLQELGRLARGQSSGRQLDSDAQAEDHRANLILVFAA